MDAAPRKEIRLALVGGKLHAAVKAAFVQYGVCVVCVAATSCLTEAGGRQPRVFAGDDPRVRVKISKALCMFRANMRVKPTPCHVVMSCRDLTQGGQLFEDATR